MRKGVVYFALYVGEGIEEYGGTGVYLICLTAAFYNGKSVQRCWVGDPTVPASAPAVCKEEGHIDKQSYRLAFP